MVQSPLDGRLAALFVRVRNLDRAVAFYHKILGLPATAATPFDQIVVLRLANGVDLILDANHKAEIPPPSPFALHATGMFATTDIDAAYQFMQANGVEIITEISLDPQVDFFNFKDPDGNIQMVCANKG